MVFLLDASWFFPFCFPLVAFENDLRTAEECETVGFTYLLRIVDFLQELFPETPVSQFGLHTGVFRLAYRFLFRSGPTFLGILTFATAFVCFDGTVDLLGAGDDGFLFSGQMGGYGLSADLPYLPASGGGQPVQ